MPNLKITQDPVVTPTGSDHVPGIQGGANKRFTIQSIIDLFAGSFGTGDVVGPGVAVDGNFASYDLTTGKLLKDSLYSPSSFDAAGSATTAETNAKAYADGLIVGLWDDRGSFDASLGSYPSSGGSGTAGAIKKGDTWTVSVAGTLPTGQVVEIGDIVRSLIDTPGNTQANWAIQQNNIGYTAENSANKDTSGGYAGLTLFKINFRNVANTFTSFFTNSNTAARTYTFQDRNGTISDDTDLALKAPLRPATSKTTLVDADEVTGNDSAASFGQIKTTWTNVKLFLKTYFDTLYITASQTVTFTNKRVTRRVVTTTQAAAPAINTDNGDVFTITGLAQAITSFTTNLTGTPVADDMIIINITDNGTARAITWGASFEASTVALPTMTVISTLLKVGFIWNSATSKWRCVAVA